MLYFDRFDINIYQSFLLMLINMHNQRQGITNFLILMLDTTSEEINSITTISMIIIYIHYKN